MGFCSGDLNYNPMADVNCDGCVTIADVGMIGDHIGNPSCNP